MNKLKRVLSGTLALAMAASMMTACGKDDSSAGGGTTSGGGDVAGKTTVHVYTFTDETQQMIDDTFLADPANKAIADKYNFVYHLEADAPTFIQNVESALTKTEEAPDLFVADADYAMRFAQNEKTASLADLGITINEADYYTYTLDFTSVDGVRKGLSHQAAPGVVLYRRDYAEEVLGSADPAEVQKSMSDWTKFKETADKMKEKGYYMISGVDELKRCFMNNRKTAWVDADLNYTPDEDVVKQMFETTKALVDDGEVQFEDKTQWTANWYKGMQEGVFCFFGCTWYLHYTIKPNCVTEKTGEKDKDGNATVTDADYKVGNGSYGLWGAIEGPAPYFWGGTWWFGSKQCIDDGTSEAVKAVIEYFCVNDDSVKAYMEKTGDFPAKKNVAADLKSDNDFLAGQDHYEIFRPAAENVNVGTCCKYDADFNKSTDTALVKYCTGGVDLQGALDLIKSETKKVIPELK